MRIAVLFLIVITFWAAIFLHFNIPQKAVLGVKAAAGEQAVDPEEMKKLQAEIENTKKVLEVRPDYAAAWNRLSALYESVGEPELAKQAKEKAKGLNFFGD